MTAWHVPSTAALAALVALAAAAPGGVGAARHLHDYTFDPQTSQGACVQALSMVPSDVSIDGLDCGEGGGVGGGGGGGGGSGTTCPADSLGPSAVSFLGQAMLQAVSSGDAQQAALVTSYAGALVLAQFLTVTLSADPTCLSRAPAAYMALGQVVQLGASQTCGGSAGTELAQAIAASPTVMSDAVTPQAAALEADPNGAQKAVTLAAQAAYPSILAGYQQLIQECGGTLTSGTSPPASGGGGTSPPASGSALDSPPASGGLGSSP